MHSTNLWLQTRQPNQAAFFQGERILQAIAWQACPGQKANLYLFYEDVVLKQLGHLTNTNPQIQACKLVNEAVTNAAADLRV